MVLLAGTGSGVPLLAETRAVNAPPAVGVKPTVQSMRAPEASGDPVGTAGVQDMEAPAGRPEMAHEAAAAGLGPALVQLKLPDAGVPTAMEAGRVSSVALMSADSPGL